MDTAQMLLEKNINSRDTTLHRAQWFPTSRRSQIKIRGTH
jgi:hypothetical protein